MAPIIRGAAVPAIALSTILLMAAAPSGPSLDLKGWVRPGALACDTAKFECETTPPDAWTSVTVLEAGDDKSWYVRSGKRRYMVFDAADLAVESLGCRVPLPDFRRGILPPAPCKDR